MTQINQNNQHPIRTGQTTGSSPLVPATKNKTTTQQAQTKYTPPTNIDEAITEFKKIIIPLRNMGKDAFKEVTKNRDAFLAEYKKAEHSLEKYQTALKNIRLNTGRPISSNICRQMNSIIENDSHLRGNKGLLKKAESILQETYNTSKAYKGQMTGRMFHEKIMELRNVLREARSPDWKKCGGVNGRESVDGWDLIKYSYDNKKDIVIEMRDIRELAKRQIAQAETEYNIKDLEKTVESIKTKYQKAEKGYKLSEDIESKYKDIAAKMVRCSKNGDLSGFLNARDNAADLMTVYLDNNQILASQFIALNKDLNKMLTGTTNSTQMVPPKKDVDIKNFL